jgi:DNA-binding transcriptional ArsR family regulator
VNAQLFNRSIVVEAFMSAYSADFDRCDCQVIHEDVVDAVRAALPDEEILLDAADLFKMFGDSTRIRILSALQHSEMCVCDIAALLGMTKSAISHQLRALRQTKLVKFRKDGKVVFYSLDDDHIGGIIAMGLAHVCE